MNDDLEEFIKLQKEKLSAERRGFRDEVTDPNYAAKSPRRKWDQDNRTMEEVQKAIKQNTAPRGDTPEIPLAAKLGQHEEKRKRLNEEKRREYNDLISKQRGFSRRNGEVDANVASLPGLRDSQSAKARKIAERNREYNDFLKLKNAADGQRRLTTRQADEQRYNVRVEETIHDSAPRAGRRGDNRSQNRAPSPNRRPEFLTDAPRINIGDNAGAFSNVPAFENLGPEGGKSLPIDDREAELKRKEEERNREYNEFLRQQEQRGPRRRRLSTPETGLDFRRHQRTRSVGEGGAAGVLPLGLGAGAPIAEPRKGWGTPRYNELLDQKRAEETQYRRDAVGGPLQPAVRPLGGPLQLGMRPAISEGALNQSFEGTRKLDQLDDMYESRKSRFKSELYGGSRPIRGHILDDDSWLDMYKSPSRYERDFDAWPRSNTTLNPNRANIQERAGRVKSAPYRDGLSFPGTAGDVATSRDQYRLELQQQMKTNADNRRSVDIAPPVPTLLHQNGNVSSVGQPTLGPYNSPVDEAYHFYARRDPLDTGPDLVAPASSYVPSLSLNQSSFLGGGGGYEPSRQERERPRAVTFGPVRSGAGPLTPRHRNESDLVTVAAIPTLTDEDQKDIKRSKTTSYQHELERQIEENVRRKNQELAAKRRDDARLEAEIANYNPFGRGGGGAPLKDGQGNVRADLRLMHRTNLDPGASSPRRGYAPPTLAPDIAYDTYLSPRPQPFFGGSPAPGTTVRQEATFARGGHGIFGDPKTDEEKMAADRYKNELQHQIDEKRRREEEKKAQLKLEEERELKYIEETRIKMQREYEEELRKQREKEGNARRRNEELRLQAEEKRREAERRGRDYDGRRPADHRYQRTADDLERERERLSVNLTSRRSPPLFALTKTDQSPLPLSSRELYQEPGPSDLRQDRAGSADVLNKLEAIRKQLQSERQRVENQLEKDKYEIDVFDPRLVRAVPVPAVPVIMSPPIVFSPVPRRSPDIFETGAINRAPVTVRRPTTDAVSADVLNEFNRYKNRDSDSRQKFRQLYPDQPVTGGALETQQLALLRHQEEQLKNIRNDPDQMGATGPMGSTSMLQSESAFLDADGQVVKPVEKETAREKRRKKKVALAEVGSATSLNTEINKKNDARLKKLRNMHDDESLQDPDDILDRFISRQQHQRPTSGTTLNDDEAWLRPSN